MSSATLWTAKGSSSNLWRAKGSSSNLWIAKGSSSNLWKGQKSSADQWTSRGSDTLTTLNLPLNASALANLDRSLTINGTTVTPSFLYLGKDATTSSFPATVGTDLPIAGAGSDPTPSQGCPTMAAADQSVLFNAGKSYQAAAAATGDITTEDFVVELVFKKGVIATQGIHVGKHSVGTTLWVISEGVSNAVILDMNDSSGYLAVSSAALVPGVWYHAMLFVDRSGSAQWYVDGVASGSAIDFSSGQLTLANANKLTIGAKSDGTSSPLDETAQAHCAMWKSAAWLDTHLQAAVALERFQKLWGIYPQAGRGTLTPTAATRASFAVLDKVESGGDRNMYRVASGALRVCSRPDTGAVVRKGYLPEPGATNLAKYAIDYTSAAWVKGQASIITTPVSTPLGTLSANILHEDATPATNHNVAQGITVAGTTQYCHWVLLKKLNRTWALLYQAGLAPVAYCFFDLGNGALGTAGGTSGQGMIDLGDEWYLCWYAYTTVGAGLASFRCYVAEADNDFTFDGLDQDSLIIAASQVEAGAYPSSLIVTTSAAATRVADVLTFKGDDGNVPVGAKKITFDVMVPNRTPPAAAVGLMTLSDGGAAADRIAIATTAAGVITLTTAATAGSAGLVTGTTDIFDGDQHSIEVILKTNNLQLKVDGVAEGTADTTATMPDDIDVLQIGADVTPANQPGVLVSNVKVYRI